MEFAVVDELTGRSIADIAVVDAPRGAVVDPGSRSPDPHPTFAVTARVQPQPDKCEIPPSSSRLWSTR